MEVIAKCQFLHDQLGRVEKGQKINVNERQLKQLQHFKWVEIPVEIHQAKVTTDNPLSAPGAEVQSSASPAAQALPQTMLPQSKRGRGRPRKGESL